MAGVGTRTYRWLPADGKRHAVPGGRVVPGDEIATLVGERVTVPTQRLGPTEWTWPTCLDCWNEAKKCTHVSLAGLAVHQGAAPETPPAASRPRKRRSA
ncbi:zinc finger protein [Kutzneria sp. CA-103260]|uniref:zinc finger protein n=1 Tax=Kutzneria sp. CA-103260 TaxID=2802641 RepID=UPI001BA6C43C